MKVLTDLFIDGQLEVQDVLLLNTVTQASTDTDKFLVLDGNAVKFRTGVQLLSDIGAGTVTSVGLTTINGAISISNSPITSSGNISINIQNASGSQLGLLTSADWNTFNTKVSPSRAVNTQYSIQGGGNLTADRFLSLVGDTASPGINKYYGINGSGARGWYDTSILSGGGPITVVELSRTVQSFNTTLGQTVFTVAGGYDVGNIDVYYNGSRLTSAEYVATNGTTVTLAFPAHRANDIVDIMIFGRGSGSWGTITGNLVDQTDLQNALNTKQNTLVSGTSIKTINGTSLLGSGDYSFTRLYVQQSTPIDSGNYLWVELNLDNSIRTFWVNS
jgi:hypothetical protein